jgi:hypothetical protein
MAKKAKAVAPRPKKELFPGVGFRGDARTEWGSIPLDYVVIMQSVVDGVCIYGPFVDEDSAYRWIRIEGEVELYDRYSCGNPPGVTFCVKWIEVPIVRN